MAMFFFPHTVTKNEKKWHSCRCTSTPDSIDNDFAMAHYDFDTPIYQAEEEAYEECDLP